VKYHAYHNVKNSEFTHTLDILGEAEGHPRVFLHQCADHEGHESSKLEFDEEKKGLLHSVLTPWSSTSPAVYTNKGQNGHGFHTATYKCQLVLGDSEEVAYKSAIHKPFACFVMLKTPF
jgi:hypothetical protein